MVGSKRDKSTYNLMSRTLKVTKAILALDEKKMKRQDEKN